MARRPGRLESEGRLLSQWEDPNIAQQVGRPPRRYYTLRPAGERLLEEMLQQFRAVEQLPANRRVRPRARRA